MVETSLRKFYYMGRYSSGPDSQMIKTFCWLCLAKDTKLPPFVANKYKSSSLQFYTSQWLRESV